VLIPYLANRCAKEGRKASHYFQGKGFFESNSTVKSSKNVTMIEWVVRRLSLQPADVSLQVSLQNPVWQPVKGTNEKKGISIA
jgi:hypothetical protein